ncbi:MAG: hypothetical protein AB7O45_15715 [Alphaproteobacteria bacterium]
MTAASSRPASGAAAPVDAAGLDEFFMGALAAFDRAARRAAPVSRRHRFGPHAIRTSVAGAPLAQAIDDAFAHLRLPEAGEHVLEIRCWDVAATGSPPPRAPWPGEAFGLKGEIALPGQDRYAAYYQFGADTVSLFDRRRRIALYWARDGAAIPYWERSFPFRPIFHWSCLDGPLQPAHAGAVGLADAGMLITGRSGAGKTTTTVACLVGGLRYAGDDYVLVEGGAAPAVHSLYNAAKFTDDSLARFPHFASWVWNPARTGDEKALVYGHRAFPEALIATMPLRAIGVPVVTGGRDTVIRRVSPTVAIRALAPTTLAQLPGQGAETLAKLSRLCAAVPCVEIAAGTDLAQIPRAIRDYLESA